MAMRLSSIWTSPKYRFGVIAMSFGAGMALILSAVPYYLRQAGVSVESIGWYAALSQLPLVLQFLYAPLIDVGLRRRTYFLLLSYLSAAFMSAGLLMPLPARQPAFLGCILIGQVFASLIPSCYGGLAATTLDKNDRDKAASWFNVGTLGGGALGALLLLELVRHASIAKIAVGLLVLRMASATLVLTIPEGAPEKAAASQIIAKFARELAAAARSKDARLGMLLCVLPTSGMSLNYFLPAVSTDYQPSARLAAVVNGWMGWALTGLGSYVGGLACARWKGQIVYLASVVVLAASEFLLSSLPMQPASLLVGALAYYLVQGVVLTAWSTIIFTLISEASQSASTQYNLFGSAQAISISAMVYLDGVMHGRYGLRALYWADASFTLLAALAVAGIGLLLRTSRERVGADAMAYPARSVSME